MKKIPASIQSLHIDGATYKLNPVTITPTFINFFYGNNGSGKSTIAETLKNGSGITWSNNIASQDCKLCVYNADYIKANLANYDNLPGVFTFNEENIQIQNQIDTLTKQKEELFNENGSLLITQMDKTYELHKVEYSFQETCWSKAGDIRSDFKQTITGKLKKNIFAEEVLKNSNSVNHDLNKLKSLYDTAYSKNVVLFQKFSVIKDTAVLDNIASLDLIERKIISSSDTPFANFIKAMNSTAWVKQGIDNYHSVYNGKCPFCQQQLPSSFEDDIKACFDEQFEKETQAITNLQAEYKDSANTLFVPISKIPESNIPDAEIAAYKDKLSALKGVIASNLELIAKKQQDYGIAYQLEPTKPLLDELADMITNFNQSIEEHNAIVLTKPAKQQECKKRVWELISYRLKDEIRAYNTSIAILNQELKDAEQQYLNNASQIEVMEQQVSILLKKTVNTRDSIESINRLLKDSGFQGFYLREKVSTPNVYEVIRNDSSIASNLSEGEKNFIAFLYFYHQIKGSDTPDEKNTDKIVIIDDPVSSMDSGTLFIVSALIREMICVCENNVQPTDTYVKDRYIKQLFILTHNTYFHQEITYDRVKDYQFVNFYLVSKNDNKSSIRLCEKQNPEIPSEMMNYNPVQNSYAALWEEYKTLEAPIPLMNVIRRILEYYFLQLCGYDGTTLRDVILKQNKEKFICTDENGNNDYSAYQLASAMLSYIQTKSSLGITDGINYVDNCVDVLQTKETFKKIFTLMNQSQHYEMMMNKS
ncbi:AAA family ATPase [Gardnerella vaginalis]|uniref:AAA family ATPase n=1 Tax=Gardnerella vaginalis TaxID=2702 RepID=UPI0039F066EA